MIEQEGGRPTDAKLSPEAAAREAERLAKDAGISRDQAKQLLRAADGDTSDWTVRRQRRRAGARTLLARGPTSSRGHKFDSLPAPNNLPETAARLRERR